MVKLRGFSHLKYITVKKFRKLVNKKEIESLRDRSPGESNL